MSWLAADFSQEQIRTNFNLREITATQVRGLKPGDPIAIKTTLPSGDHWDVGLFTKIYNYHDSINGYTEYVSFRNEETDPDDPMMRVYLSGYRPPSASTVTHVYYTFDPPKQYGHYIASVVEKGKLPPGSENEIAAFLRPSGTKPSTFLPQRKKSLMGEYRKPSEFGLNKLAEMHQRRMRTVESKEKGGSTRRAKGRRYRKRAGRPLTRRVRSS